jgi:E3 ubiquitin-protein ligase MYCBP2
MEEVMMQEMVKNDPSLIQCSCNGIIAIAEGKADMNLKDDQGKKLTQEAAVHMAKFRIRCPKCEKNFCTKCLEEPYHLGKTCEQFKSFKAARKCRYCDEQIK